MRTMLAALLVVSIVALLAPTTGAANGPMLRVLPGSTLAVQGSGFVPRTVVRLRVVSSGKVLRVVLVRAGAGGGFTTELPMGRACGVTVVSATGVRDRHARVATGFARQCPPPPPIQAPGAG